LHRNIDSSRTLVITHTSTSGNHCAGARKCMSAADSAGASGGTPPKEILPISPRRIHEVLLQE